MRALAVLAALAGVARADGPPYRLWWGAPGDDTSAIEIDDPDLGTSRFETRWQLALSSLRCAAASERSSERREIRVEALAADGTAHWSKRCQLPLAAWSARLGEQTIERLNDELDAHQSFLQPRHHPKTPPGPPPVPDDAP